jgi:hypothetical protein
MKSWLTLCALTGLLCLFAGCSPATTKKDQNSTTKKDPQAEAILFDETEVFLEPGETKQIAASKGKPESADVPDKSGLKVEVKDGKITLSAAEDAKEASHEVKVKAGSSAGKFKATIAEPIAFEDKDITLEPGKEKAVEFKKGKPVSAKAPEGLKAEVKDGKLTVSADDKAKDGKYEVTVKGAGPKPAVLKVTIKKKS